MPKCFRDSIGVLCCWNKSGSERNKESVRVPEEPVMENKLVPELFHVVNVPERPCPPGYKRDRSGDSAAETGEGFCDLMPTHGNRDYQRDCSTCFQRFNQPVQFAKGHQICRECSERVNEGAETRCSKASSGCRAEGTPVEMKKHRDVCYYRWIRCAYHLQCGRHEISLSEYKNHLEEVHRPYIKKIRLNEEDEIVLKTDTHSFVRTGNILRIEGTDVYFVRRCLLDLNEDVLLICLHYIGENEEAKKYTYKVSINQGFHAKYTCTSYCLPYVENSNSCVDLLNCNVLRPSKLFLTKNYLQEIHTSVTIKRIRNY